MGCWRWVTVGKAVQVALTAGTSEAPLAGDGAGINDPGLTREGHAHA